MFHGTYGMEPTMGIFMANAIGGPGFVSYTRGPNVHAAMLEDMGYTWA